MDELISRTEFLKGFAYHAPEERFSPNEVIYLIGKAPTVDAEPVRHGAWVGKHKSTCSECGDVNLRAYVGPTPLYCQVCGARMDLDPAMAEKEDSR